MKNAADVRFWRDKDLPGIETCRVVGSRHAFPNHAHEHIYAIGLMEKGRNYSLGGARCGGMVRPGELVLINPGQIHAGVPVDNTPVTYRMLYVNEAVVRAAASDLEQNEISFPELQALVVGDQRLRELLLRFCRQMETDAGVLEKESLLFEGLAYMLTHFAGIRRPSNRTAARQREIKGAIAFMKTRLDSKVTLDDVAQVTGLSRYHFLRVFKQTVGVPPHAFHTLMRIDAAKQKLLEGVSPAQVALETGFSDQSHFTNKFRQLTGATPGQYLGNR